MANISVRIDEQMKKEMEQMRQVNWSEIIREAIKNRLNQEKQKNLAKAADLPIFLSATGRQHNAEVARRYVEARIPDWNSEIVKQVLELHEKGVSMYKLLNEVHKKHGIFLTERIINRIIRSRIDK